MSCENEIIRFQEKKKVECQTRDPKVHGSNPDSGSIICLWDLILRIYSLLPLSLICF